MSANPVTHAAITECEVRYVSLGKEGRKGERGGLGEP